MILSDNNAEQSDITPVSRSFHERLVSINNLGNKDFQEWIFHPDMLFGSYNKWWGDLGKRNISHEGLDLCYYRTKKGDIQHLNEKTKVQVMFDGLVVTTCNDFLGESVFVRHDFTNSNKSRLYTIYGHIKPDSAIYQGQRLAEGDIIGILSNKRNDTGVVPYHLHISIAWISDMLKQNNLEWQILRNENMVRLLDPLKIIKCPYSTSSDI